MPDLKTLIVTGTKITAAGVSTLRQECPHLNVVWVPGGTVIPAQLQGAPYLLHQAGTTEVDSRQFTGFVSTVTHSQRSL
jgi:hypothetical protein